MYIQLRIHVTLRVLLLLTLNAKAYLHPDPPRPTVFIHIPKTGGTFVEDRLRDVGINAGRFAARRLANGSNALGYRTKSLPCSPWHRVPSHFVPNSFCVVRSITHRLRSEYTYWLGFGHGRERYDCSCPSFRRWSRKKLAQVRNNAAVNDCHFIPQVEYARRCSVLVDYDRLHAFMRSTYGIHDNLTRESYPMGIKPRCKELKETRCLTAGNLRGWEQLYREDVELVFYVKKKSMPIFLKDSASSDSFFETLKQLRMARNTHFLTTDREGHSAH